MSKITNDGLTRSETVGVKGLILVNGTVVKPGKQESVLKIYRFIERYISQLFKCQLLGAEVRQLKLTCLMISVCVAYQVSSVVTVNVSFARYIYLLWEKPWFWFRFH